MIELQLFPLGLGVGLLFLFIVLGLPIGFALGLSGLIGLLPIMGVTTWDYVAMKAVSQVAVVTLCTLPLFTFMGEIMSESKITVGAFELVRRWMNWMPGNQAIAAIVSSILFGSVSGSSLAAIVVIGKQSLPEMKKQGYSKTLAIGAVGCAGVLAILIPPSAALVLYGIITNTSIGQLFMASVIPGLVLATLYIVTIIIWVIRYPEAAPKDTIKVSWSERITSLRALAPFIILIFIILGTIYLGVCTATEAAAVGVLIALCIAFGMRQISFKGFFKAAWEATTTSGMLFIVLVGAMIFAYFTNQTGAIDAIAKFIQSLQINRWLIMLSINLLLLILGTFMDVASMTMIMLPILYQIVVGLGFDPVWFAIIFTINMEIGDISPPVGMSIFVLQGVAPDTSYRQIMLGQVPFVACQVLLMVLLCIFPQLALWLPSKMIG